MSNKNNTLNKEILENDEASEIICDELLFLRTIDQLVEMGYVSPDGEYVNHSLMSHIFSSKTPLHIKKQLISFSINKYNLLAILLGGFYFTYKRLGFLYYASLSLASCFLLLVAGPAVNFAASHTLERILFWAILFSGLNLCVSSIYMSLRYNQYKKYKKLPENRCISETLTMTTIYFLVALIPPTIVVTVKTIFKIS
jgi:hypothetical protein